MAYKIHVSSGCDLCWPDVFRTGSKDKNIVATDLSIKHLATLCNSYKITGYLYIYKQTSNSKLHFEKNPSCNKKQFCSVVSQSYWNQTGLFHTLCHARIVTDVEVTLSLTELGCYAGKWWGVITLVLCALVNTEWEKPSEAARTPNHTVFPTGENYYPYNDFFFFKDQVKYILKHFVTTVISSVFETVNQVFVHTSWTKLPIRIHCLRSAFYGLQSIDIWI